MPAQAAPCGNRRPPDAGPAPGAGYESRGQHQVCEHADAEDGRIAERPAELREGPLRDPAEERHVHVGGAGNDQAGECRGGREVGAGQRLPFPAMAQQRRERDHSALPTTNGVSRSRPSEPNSAARIALEGTGRRGLVSGPRRRIPGRPHGPAVSATSPAHRTAHRARRGFRAGADGPLGSGSGGRNSGPPKLRLLSAKPVHSPYTCFAAVGNDRIDARYARAARKVV